MKDVAVVAYCRTGIARATRGALNRTHGIPMTAHVLRHAVERAGIDGSEVEDVVVGRGLPEGATGHNIGRNAALEAGFGVHVPGMTITRYWGSGITTEITNVHGGAVALGHPYGMSGIRYVGSTLLELGRRNKRRAVVGVCTAGGMATAAYLERA